ncbi:DUF5993 family protein [Castellaniella sp. GW247-6E4]|uniref:DUF5993 family protein n=1 Tax=Castellaniella sp. GW247-6E4 TaxID=3140380 RepID=UPI0033150397
MIMMLPFLSALLSVWFAIRGRRGACIGLWLATLLIFTAWSRYHMTGVLPISL